MICTSRLHLTRKEAGRLTIKEFNEMYTAYKIQFNIELSAKRGSGYAMAETDAFEEVVDF